MGRSLAPSIRLFSLLAASGVVALGACSDSLHLDPDPGGGSGPVSVASAGGGGAAPIPCNSNADCPAPTSICDQVQHTCVECLELQHCAFRPGTVCSQGACVCPVEQETFCEGYNKPFESRAPRCADLQTSTNDCGACGHACFGACMGAKCVDAWEPTPFGDAPTPRARPSCVWTGSSLIAWGGDTGAGVTSTGGVLDLAAGEWRPTSLANAPSPRSYTRGVWTGETFIVWGGYDGNPLGTGAVYDPKSNTWKAMSNLGAPSPRYSHTTVWADSVKRVLVWGGYNGMDNLDTGGQYDPAADAWTPMTTMGGATRRRDHTSVWTGAQMIVYGGVGFDGAMDENAFLAAGGAYDPAGDAWVAVDTTGQPGPRARHSAAWSGTGMLIFGGDQAGMQPFLNDGATYTTAWTPMGGSPPSARHFQTAVWLDTPIARMIVWGGDGPAGRLADGGVFDPEPAMNTWQAKPMATGPSARTAHCAVAAGAKMVVWGGDTAAGLTNTGGVFDPAVP